MGSEGIQLSEKQASFGDGGEFASHWPIEWSAAKKSSFSDSDLQKKQSKQMNDQGFIDFGTNDPLLIAQAKDSAKPMKDAHEKAAIKGLPHEKLLPQDGQEYSLKQMLNDYKTPFTTAYDKSKHLKDGEPGKSKTLEEIVDRLKACPWSDKIRIKFDSQAKNPDYNPVENTITVLPQKSAAEQIELFVHEGFHATHQALNEMYMGDNPLGPKEYANVLGGLEAKTFEAEIRVHNEITAKMGAGPVSYAWRDADKHKQPDMDLGKLYATKGFEGLKHFILDEAFTDMQLDGKWHSWNYRTYYEATQPRYAANWSGAHAELERRFKNNPALRHGIESGGY